MRSYTPLAIISCMALISSASAQLPDFINLDHATRPLVQEQSESLLPELPPADLQGWNPRGDVSVAEVGGEQVLRFGPMQGEQEAFVETWIRDVKPHTLYQLTYDLLIPADAAMSKGTHSGFYGLLAHYSEDGGLPGPLRMADRRRSDEWMPREEYLFTHGDAINLRLELRWYADAGDMLVRNLRLIEAPVSAEEGRVVLQTQAGEWGEARDEVPAGQATDEPVLWPVRDIDALRPHSLPPAESGPQALELGGTPGEMVVGAIGLWTPRPLDGLRFSIEPGDQATAALDETPEVQRVVFLPRKTDYYGRGRTFHYVPDFFLASDTFDCPAGEASGLWLSYRISDDAGLRPNTRWLLKVEGDGFEASLPVNIRAYSFDLADLSDKTRHLYLDPSRWRNRSDEQALAEIADVRDHGYESVPLSSVGRVEVEDGNITGFTLNDESLRIIRLAQEGGLEGPFGFWNGRFPGYVRAALGLPEDVLSGYADTWPEEVFEGEVQALKLLKEAVTAAGIEDPFIVAIDEPGYWKAGSPAHYAWDMRVAQEAGWDTYCTTSTAPPDPLGLHVTYHCYGGGKMTNDPALAAEILEVTHAHGQQCWYYCTGSYSGQVGNMLRNRYLAGFMFFRSGWDGTASWTFQRYRGDAFDDFQIDDAGKERTGQACSTYPDPRADAATATGNLDTPQWEALRQSWYDHRYAATLQQAIDDARQRDPAAAEAAQQRIDALMAALPWNGAAFAYEGFRNSALDETRAAIAEEIMKLR